MRASSISRRLCAARAAAAQALLQLCRLRNTHPAFQGRVFVDDSSPPHALHVRWYTPHGDMAVLDADMASRAFTIRTTPHPAADALGEGGDAAVAAAAALGSVSSVFSLDGLDVPARQAARRRIAAALATGGDWAGGGGDSGPELQVLDLSWAWQQQAAGVAPAAEEGGDSSGGGGGTAAARGGRRVEQQGVRSG